MALLMATDCDPLDLCVQAYRAGSVAHGAAAVAAASEEDEGVWDEADTEQSLDLDQVGLLLIASECL